MSQKTILVAAIWLVGLLGVSLFLQSQKTASAPALDEKAPPALTLLEAWSIVESYGKEWRQNAAITSIRSIDIPEDTPTAGHDGKRRGWLALLVSQDASLWLRLVDGAIADQSEQPSLVGASPLIKPKIDSPEALRQAIISLAGLEGANDPKEQGYHFIVDTSREGQIQVRGESHSWKTRVFVDSQDGDVESVQIYTYAPVGGILFSSDGGKNWHASTLQRKMVTDLAVDPSDDWRGYALAAEQEGIVLYQSDDGGRTWKHRSDLPAQAGDWPFDLLVLRDKLGQRIFLVGTQNGLWISAGEQDWKQYQELASGPLQWLAVARQGEDYRVFAVVSSGEKRGLYHSKDLVHWTKLNENVYRLFESFDQQIVLAAPEDNMAKGLLLDSSSETTIQIPGPVLHAAGDFLGPSPVLLHFPASGIGITDELGGPLVETISAPIASLAVAPDFPQSQLVIAGGFRGGLYRSTDGGRSWERILENPSSILPGNNEIYDVIFLSPSLVIAINGGELSWQDIDPETMVIQQLPKTTQCPDL